MERVFDHRDHPFCEALYAAPHQGDVYRSAGGGRTWHPLHVLDTIIGGVSDRSRVAAVIVRSGRLLMVRQRARGPTGRHDGLEYWVLPGGGVEQGESPEQALAREVHEEVDLTCLATRYLFDAVYPSGLTACYEVEVPADEEPRLGTDDLPCDCPRMVGLAWVPVPPSHPTLAARRSQS